MYPIDVYIYDVNFYCENECYNIYRDTHIYSHFIILTILLCD